MVVVFLGFWSRHADSTIRFSSSIASRENVQRILCTNTNKMQSHINSIYRCKTRVSLSPKLLSPPSPLSHYSRLLVLPWTHVRLGQREPRAPVESDVPAENNKPNPNPDSISQQVSALADLEARIASLGGLLTSFSSESASSPRSSVVVATPRSIESPKSVQSSSCFFPSPPARARAENSAVPVDPPRQHSSPLLQSQSSGTARNARGGGSQRNNGSRGSGGSRGSHDDSYAASLGSSGPGASSITSALAREVEALLHASSHNSSEDYVDAPRAGGGLGDAVGGGGGGVGGDGGHGSGIDGADPAGWAALEGMAERLGALIEGGSDADVDYREFDVEQAGEGAGGSVYSSSRGVMSVSSPGGGGGGL